MAKPAVLIGCNTGGEGLRKGRTSASSRARLMRQGKPVQDQEHREVDRSDPLLQVVRLLARSAAREVVANSAKDQLEGYRREEKH